jgi:hypothetical protein
MPQSTEYGESTDFPSLIDDVAFLAELERLEGEPLASPIARPIVQRPRAQQAAAASALFEPVIPRDVNRWNLHSPPPGVDPEPIVLRRPSRLAAVLAILIGLCAGAAGSAFVFSERLVQIIALVAR